MESSAENIRDARLIKRKLAPKPAVHVTAKNIKTGEEGSVKVSASFSRLDFDGMTDTFANFIQLIQGMPEYAPNEADLKLDALKAVLADLRSKTYAVAVTSNALANARINRNKVMLGKNGMAETGTAVKEYIRSVFGVKSEPSKELGKLRLAA